MNKLNLKLVVRSQKLFKKDSNSMFTWLLWGDFKTLKTYIISLNLYTDFIAKY